MNPSVNFNEMYEGINDKELLQLRFNHEEDPEDVVTDEQIYAEKKKEEKKNEFEKHDFNGDKFTEIYDE
jgi:hypothetical protein